MRRTRTILPTKSAGSGTNISPNWHLEQVPMYHVRFSRTIFAYITQTFRPSLGTHNHQLTLPQSTSKVRRFAKQQHHVVSLAPGRTFQELKLGIQLIDGINGAGSLGNNIRAFCFQSFFICMTTLPSVRLSAWVWVRE